MARSLFPLSSTVGFPPWWQSGLKTWEIWVAAPQVIWHRTWRMASAGPFPSAGDQQEFWRMGQEKAAAFSESLGAMTAQMFSVNQEAARFMLNQWWTAWINPWAFMASSPVQWFRFPSAATGRPAGARSVGASLARVVDKGLAPVHRRAMRNARRLRRRKA